MNCSPWVLPCLCARFQTAKSVQPTSSATMTTQVNYKDTMEQDRKASIEMIENNDLKEYDMASEAQDSRPVVETCFEGYSEEEVGRSLNGFATRFG